MIVRIPGGGDAVCLGDRELCALSMPSFSLAPPMQPPLIMHTNQARQFEMTCRQQVYHRFAWVDEWKMNMRA